MTAIPGTNIASGITPFDTSDAYWTHSDVYGAGGYRVVSDITERDNIPVARQKVGMLVYVQSISTVYKLTVIGSPATYEEFTVAADTDITIIGVDGISVVEFPTSTFTIGVSGNFGDANLRSEVEAISANLQAQIDAISGGSSTSYAIIGSVPAIYDNKFTISHPNVDIEQSVPVVSLTIPGSGSTIYVEAITNRTSTSFDVILSGIPSISGYAINYILNSATALLNEPSTLVAGTGINIVENPVGTFTISSTVSGGGTSDHNALLNLQGGQSNQYYHLTQTEYQGYISDSEVAGVSASLYSYTTSTSSSIFNYFTQEITNIYNEIDGITGGSGPGTSWTPIEGSGIIIDSVGDDYQFSTNETVIYDISGSGSYTPDYNDGGIHTITANGTLTINVPSNMSNGESMIFKINPNGNTVNWSTSYKFPYGVAPLSNEATIIIMSITKISNNYYATYTTGFYV